MRILKGLLLSSLVVLLLSSNAAAGIGLAKDGWKQFGNLYVVFFENIFVSEHMFSIWSEEDSRQPEYRRTRTYFFKVFLNGEEVYLPKYFKHLPDQLLGGYQFFTSNRAQLEDAIASFAEAVTSEQEQAARAAAVAEAARLASEAAESVEAATTVSETNSLNR